MNMDKEKETVRVYAELVAQECISKFDAFSETFNDTTFTKKKVLKLETVERMLRCAFIEGAMWGLERGGELAEQGFVINLSKLVQGQS